MDTAAAIYTLAAPGGLGPEGPAIEEGELFDCQLPHGVDVYRFEHVKRPRREGTYLVVVSGIAMLRRIEAQPGGKIDLVNDTSRDGCRVQDRTTVRIGDPSVTWLGRQVARLVSAGWGDRPPRATRQGKQAGYGRDNDPFGCWA